MIKTFFLKVFSYTISPFIWVITRFKKIKIIDRMKFHIRYIYWKFLLKNIGINVYIYPFVIIHYPENVEIGNFSSIAEFSHIWGKGGVKIGNNVLVASHSIITSQGHKPDAEIMRETETLNEVVIEDNVWIGANSIILPGIHIQRGSIIAAGSVVTHNVPENVTVAGVPAHIIKKRR